MFVCVCRQGEWSKLKKEGDNRIKEPDIEKGERRWRWGAGVGSSASPEASTPVLTPLPGTLRTLETLFTQQP